MAKRFSGDLQISVTCDDRNFYRTSVSRGGKSLWQAWFHTGRGPCKHCQTARPLRPPKPTSTRQR